MNQRNNQHCSQGENHDCELLQCLLNFPLLQLQEKSNPLTMQNIRNNQNANGSLIVPATRELSTTYWI